MNKGAFEDEYKKLNEAQKEAVDTLDGPVAVIAGPGTGKTQILALRVANILLKTDTKPENILALTFTNAGVISMRERLLAIMGDVAYRINIFTFHAFCEHIIKKFPFYFPDIEGAKALGDLERVEIVESIIKKNRFKDLVSFHDEFLFLNKIISGILTVKKEGLHPDEFLAKLPLWEKSLLSNDEIYYKRDFGKHKKGDLKPTEAEKISRKVNKAKELGDIFCSYQIELRKKGFYDFSDMILFVLSEMSENPDLKADTAEQYQYILVDEHQDTNEGQNALLELLTDAPHLEGKPNIFTVGDEKQSIYRFQGASREIFSRFHNLYKSIRLINLKENYRSTKNILGGAHSLITKSDSFKESEALRSNAKENEKIAVREFSNYKFELLYLAEEIKGKIQSGVSPSEIAVLYRANKNVSDIKTVFDFFRIDYTVFSKDKVLDDPDIRHLINILKVVFNPNDDHSFGKALFAVFLRIDAYDAVRILEALKSFREKDAGHIFSIMENEKLLAKIGVKDPKFFLNLAEVFKKLKTESLGCDFADFFKMFLHRIGFVKYMLASEDSRIKIQKLDKLMDEIKRQTKIKKAYDLADFIYFVDAFAKYNLDIESTGLEISEGVSLMTAHGSKGREFEYVYIINATRRSWEGSRGSGGISLPVYQYDGDIEDERRLFFVAMTRAKKILNISYARTDNDGIEHEESQFVKEIEPSFKEEIKMRPFEEKNIKNLGSFLNAESRPASVFDGAYLRDLFLKRGLNVSALNNYLECPRKYLYKNLIRIPDAYSPNLKFGDLIHKSLEVFFSESAKAEKILSKSDLLRIFDRELQKVYFLQREKEKYKERGEKALCQYYDEFHRTWTYNVWTEFSPKRNFELDNKKILKLSGKVDKVEILDEDGNVNIVDYKTGRAFSEKTKEEKSKYERQIVFYHLLLSGYDEGRIRINRSTLDFVEKNKKGDFERYSFEVTEKHLSKLREEINRCADGVLSMEFLKKGCNKKDCEWCHIAD